MDVFSYKSEYNLGDTKHLALFSDLHVDAEGSNIDLFRKHADKAANKDARFHINGDSISGILPTDRKRYSKGTDALESQAMLNELTDILYKVLSPYADFIDSISPGNHEESILRYNSYDVVLMVRTLLQQKRSKSLPPIHQGAYRGYMVFRWKYKNGERLHKFTVFRHHGAGGSAPVTKGMIDLNRISARHLANLYWIGHKHTSIQDDDLTVTTLTSYDSITEYKRKAVITPGYQQRYSHKDYSRGGIADYEDRHYGLQANGFALVQLELGADDYDFQIIKY